MGVQAQWNIVTVEENTDSFTFQPSEEINRPKESRFHPTDFGYPGNLSMTSASSKETVPHTAAAVLWKLTLLHVVGTLLFLREKSTSQSLLTVCDCPKDAGNQRESYLSPVDLIVIYCVVDTQLKETGGGHQSL